MSIASQLSIGDLERLTWKNLSSELVGKVVSLEQLKQLFPKGEDFSEVCVLKEALGYRVYGRKPNKVLAGNFLEKLAYQCKSCDVLMLGPPEIIDEDSIGEQPLSGRRGHDLYCRQCSIPLESVTLAVS